MRIQGHVPLRVDTSSIIYDANSGKTVKSKELRATILRTIKHNILFSKLPSAEINAVVDQMARVSVKEGESIITQGDHG